MKQLIKVDISIGEHEYSDFVLAESESTAHVQEAIAEALWEDPDWEAADFCSWDDGEISCQVASVTPVVAAEIAIMKKFGVL